jgi:hypothetical protein
LSIKISRRRLDRLFFETPAPYRLHELLANYTSSVFFPSILP